jgi:hypothetical protein
MDEIQGFDMLLMRNVRFSQLPSPAAAVPPVPPGAADEHPARAIKESVPAMAIADLEAVVREDLL